MLNGKLNINLYASFTIDPVTEYMAYWLKEHHLHCDTNVTMPSLLIQAIIGRKKEQDIINVLYIRFEDYLREMMSFPPENAAIILQQALEQFKMVIGDFRQSADTILVCTDQSPHQGRNIPSQVYDLIAGINREWICFLETQRHVLICSLDDIRHLYEIADVLDPTTEEIGHIPFSEEYYAAMGTYLARIIVGLRSQRYKVIVADCDNTLWAGICGEQQNESLRVEPGHYALQQFLLNKHKQGFMIALSSKNNESEVWQVFDQHPDMLLRREHIVTSRINWASKADNIADIALELNLNPDSFIFIDDSPAEIADLQTRLPMVLSLLLPAVQNEWECFLKHIWAFDKWNITWEDHNRSALYKQEQQRQAFQNTLGSLEEFIRSLEVQTQITCLNEDDISRASQLTMKTSQFNLNGLSYSEQAIRMLVADKNTFCWKVEVSDRFGAYGFTGLLIGVHAMPGTLRLDCFLLSCRVLGRRVEHAVLQQLLSSCHQNGWSRLEFKYRSTGRNKPMQCFIAEITADITSTAVPGAQRLCVLQE